MRKQDQLNTLIASLGKNEKRYFKLQASLHTGDKTFTRLFDEMAKSETYEPEKLAKKLKITKPVLAHAKAYLEKVLLNSLRNYEEDNDLHLELRSRWQEVKILHNRNQFELAFSINEKALEKALAYENFLMAFNFYELKYNLLISLHRHREATKVVQQKALCLEQLSESGRLADTISGFTNIITYRQDENHVSAKIEQDTLFKTPPEKLKSDTARIKWHALMHHYFYFIKLDAKTAAYHLLCGLHIFEARPELIYTYPSYYVAALTNLCTTYSKLENYTEALKFAQKLMFETNGHRKDIPVHFCKEANLGARYHEMYSLCQQQQFAEAAKKAAEIGEEMDQLPLNRLVVAKHFHALSLFYTEKYHEALKVCDELHGYDPEIMKERQFSNKLLIVMIHFALKNYTLLPHYITSAASWAKRHQLNEPGTSELVLFFNQLKKLPSDNHHDLFFTELDQMIQKDIFKNLNKDLGLKRWIQNNVAAKLQVKAA